MQLLKREKMARPTRWSPTPEQLMFLEEMYRKGLRNPNAIQIQSITSHLSSFGKIEGKNVFYWFQNHKARDRQKLKKKLLAQMNQQQILAQYPIDAHSTTTTSNSNNNTNTNTLFHCPTDQYQICPLTSTGLLQEVYKYTIIVYTCFFFFCMRKLFHKFFFSSLVNVFFIFRK